MSPTTLPKSTKAIVLKQSPSTSKPVYNDAVLEEKPIPPLKEGEILIRIGAAGFNHRDVSPHSARRWCFVVFMAQKSVTGLDTEGTLSGYPAQHRFGI
jgi:NADPH:quinone reductase-like Zn-dependent oxidoreductase